MFHADGYNFAPAPAYAQQDAIFIQAFAILQSAIDQHAFPAASVAITRHGKLVALKGLGRFTYQAESPVATHATVFDLASVSKVVATTSMAMILYERARLDLETPVAAIVPEFAATRPSKDARRTHVTIENLLAHSSGLPAYEKLYLEAKTKHELFHAALNAPLMATPGTRAVYSDIGFMVLDCYSSALPGKPSTSSVSAKFSRRWLCRIRPSILRTRGGYRFHRPPMSIHFANVSSKAK